MYIRFCSCVLGSIDSLLILFMHYCEVLVPLHLCYCCQLMKLTLELYVYIFKVFLLISLCPFSTFLLQNARIAVLLVEDRTLCHHSCD